MSVRRIRLLIELGQLSLGLRYGPPDATQTSVRPGMVKVVEPTDRSAQKRSGATDCEPFDGPDHRWRERVLYLAFVELGVEQPRLAWPTPTCGTQKCLTFTHLAWKAPKRLEYPAGVCIYCGLLASTEDHLLPRTWTGETVRRHVLTVPACLECNSCIGDRYLPSITRRRAEAQLHIAKKCRKVLAMPEWTPEALAELGKTLRSLVERGLHEQKLARARLAWPEDPDYDLRVTHLSGIENPYEIGLLDEPRRAA